jgi:hypothetical protein
MKADCWPCICKIAEMDKVKIKGCWFSLFSRQSILNIFFTFLLKIK